MKCIQCHKPSGIYVYCKSCEKENTLKGPEKPIQVPAIHFKGSGWASKKPTQRLRIHKDGVTTTYGG